jgi:hypothetical protein
VEAEIEIKPAHIDSLQLHTTFDLFTTLNTEMKEDKNIPTRMPLRQ